MRNREHDTWDYQCTAYAGHNAVPAEVDIYERRCLVCNPYTDAEADALLRSTR